MTSLSDIKQVAIVEHLNQHLHIRTTFQILTILTLKVWSIEFIHLKCSKTKLIPLIPKPHFLELHLSISNGFVSSNI